MFLDIYPERLKITERDKQMVPLQTNIISIGIQKAFDVTLNLKKNTEGPYRRVYNVTTIRVRWLPLSVI